MLWEPQSGTQTQDSRGFSTQGPPLHSSYCEYFNTNICTCQVLKVPVVPRNTDNRSQISFDLSFRDLDNMSDNNSLRSFDIGKDIVQGATDKRSKRRADVARNQRKYRSKNISIIQKKARRDRLDVLHPIEQKWSKQCTHCGCLYLSSATASQMKRCCQNGFLRNQVHGFQQLPSPPEFIDLIRSDVPHFSRASSMYNNIMAMAATGVQNQKGGGYEADMVGDHSVKILGRTYHFIPKAHNKSTPSGGISYFTFDCQESLVQHVNNLNKNKLPGQDDVPNIVNGVVRDNVRLEAVNTIRDLLLRHNRYAQCLRVLGNYITDQADTNDAIEILESAVLPQIGQPLILEHFELEDHDPEPMDLVIDANSNPHVTENILIPTVQEAMDYFEVAQITNERANGERILTTQYKNGEKRLVDMNSEFVEVLTYPLLFMNGGEGWGTKYKDDISFFKYLASRLLMPDLTDINDPTSYLMFPSKQNPYRTIPVNMYQLLARVGQVAMVDSMSRAEDRKLNFIKRNQDLIFSGNKNKKNADLADDEESEASDDEPDMPHNPQQQAANDYWIPSSFFGSKRHLRTKALNALRIVSEYGKATFFLTLTCNQEWPEIQSQLLEGQSPFDRPDIVNQVFHHRLLAFLHNLKAGHYIKHKTVFLIYCIEFQHRGLPHAHIVFRTEGHADNCPMDERVAFIDENISAEMPVPDEALAAVQTPYNIYCELVRKHMIHKCSVAVNGCKKDANSLCKRGYSDDAANVEATYLDALGYPVYRRRANKDRRVVPHNREILLAWKGHANLEYAANAKCVLYLYNYLYKGIKSVSVRLGNAETEEQLYLKGRIISAMSAVYRILGFNTYPATSPRVKVVKVKDEDAVNYLIKDGKWSYLLIYWNRPQTDEMSAYTFTQLFKHYEVYPTLPSRFINTTNDIGVNYFEIIVVLKKVPKTLYLCKRVNTEMVVCRLEKLYPSAGDIFYLQMIIASCCPRSFQEARTFNNTQYAMYEQAALARGIVQEAVGVRELFLELQMCNSPRDCRGIFSVLLLHGFPMRVVFDDPNLRSLLLSDFLENHTMGEAENEFLKDLKIRIQRAGGKRMSSYGFDEPVGQETELKREMIRYNHLEYIQKLMDIQMMQQNNTKQQQIYDEVTDSINKIINHKQWVENPYAGNPGEPDFLVADETRQNPLLQFYFISGAAGTGKTALTKQLLYYARSRKAICLGCASTTLAAQLYPEEGFTTAHSLFRYPVEDAEYGDDGEAELKCNFNGDVGLERLELLDYCHVVFWDEFVTNHRNLFQDVIKTYRLKKISCLFICSGDFRQILPVVKNGDPEDVLAATISACPDWKYFKKRYLSVNMRLTALQATLPITASVEQTDYVNTQRRYNDAILALAEGKDSDDCITIDKKENAVYIETTVALKGFQYFTTSDDPQVNDTLEPIAWLYPSGYQPSQVSTCSILAATNKAVDKWNSIIQAMNPSAQHVLKAHDTLCQVDDPHGHLSNTMPDEILRTIKVPNVPEHDLILKVNDICIILRHMTSIGPHVATNTRVRINQISNHLITARILSDDDQPGKLIRIPKIRFKFPINNNNSYSLLRTQFPLRLAYSMTYNKSQGQTLRKVLLDTTEEPFAHGHAYVSLSRIRSSESIRIYCKPEHIIVHDEQCVPTIKNIVYKEALEYINGPLPH